MTRRSSPPAPYVETREDILDQNTAKAIAMARMRRYDALRLQDRDRLKQVNDVFEFTEDHLIAAVKAKEAYFDEDGRMHIPGEET